MRTLVNVVALILAIVVLIIVVSKVIEMINNVITLKEAAERWGKSTDLLRQACISRNGNPPRFEIGVEARQSKHIWLGTRDGMEQLYGGEK